MSEGRPLLDEPYTIRDEQLDTGLRGMPVGTCRTSSVSATEGVSYVGYPIAELADLPCEDVVFLLREKRLPDAGESEAFRADLARRSGLPEEVAEGLRHFPKSGHPMEWLVAGLVMLGACCKSKDRDYAEDGLDVVARATSLVAAIFRLKNGWGDPIPPREDLPLHESFAHQLGAPDAHPLLPELLRTFYVLHADHGGGNLSTFVGKAVASGLADQFSALAAAMTALYGPLHGRANQECLRFAREIGSSDPDTARERVRAVLAEGGKVYGFGHAVLRAEDPRARIQYAFAEQHFADDPTVRTVLTLREVVPPLLAENPKIQNPHPNVDAVSGALLNAAGLRDPDFYTLLFGWARVAGISAQVLDERTVLRGGRGVPIYRPRYVAVDQPRRSRTS